MAALSLGIPALSNRSAFSRSRSARSKRAACSLAYSRMADAARGTKVKSGAASLFRRPKSRPSARLATRGKERSLIVLKRGRLLSLMMHMINRLAPTVVILLAMFLLAGCSGIFGESPREQADEAISSANKSISEHNELFDEARATYADVKEKIDSGDDPSKEKDNIAEAKNTLERARNDLQDARESLEVVDDLDVDPSVKEYASLLSEAMDAQLAAEAKEIQFYGILEGDPALQDDREKALDLLSEVGAGYKEAEITYSEAQNLADEHPQLIEGAPKSQ